MKNKSVKIMVTVSSVQMKRLEARVRPLGMDALTALARAVRAVDSFIDSLVEDSDFLFGGYVFPSRAAAQRAVNADNMDRKVSPWSKYEASFLTTKGEVCEELYPPGARKLHRRLVKACDAVTRQKAVIEAAKGRLLRMEEAAKATFGFPTG